MPAAYLVERQVADMNDFDHFLVRRLAHA